MAQENSGKSWNKFIESNLFWCVISVIGTVGIVLCSPFSERIYQWAHETWPVNVTVELTVTKGHPSTFKEPFSNLDIGVPDDHGIKTQTTDAQGTAMIDVPCGWRSFTLTHSGNKWTTTKKIKIPVMPRLEPYRRPVDIQVLDISGCLWPTDTRLENDLLEGLYVCVKECPHYRDYVNEDGSFTIKDIPVLEINSKAKLTFSLRHKNISGPLYEWKDRIDTSNKLYEFMPSYGITIDKIKKIVKSKQQMVGESIVDSSGLVGSEPEKRDEEISFGSDQRGFTPLIKAAWNGQKDKVVQILKTKTGLDVNQKADNGFTPLIAASYRGFPEIVTELLNAGADLNIRDKWTYTPLIWAANEGHHEVVEILLNYRANPDDEEAYHNTALMRASVRGHTEVVKLLLANGADPNKANVNGWTALMESMICKKLEIASILIGYSANVNARDYGKYERRTPLMWAAQTGQKQMAILLMNLGADKQIRTSPKDSPQDRGKTAAELARIAKHNEIADMIDSYRSSQ